MFASWNSLYFFPTSFSNNSLRWPNSGSHQERIEDHNVPEVWDWCSTYFPWLNVKDYVEGQMKNLEKDSNGDFTIRSKTSKKKRKTLLHWRQPLVNFKVTWKSWNLNLVFKKTSSEPRMSKLPIYWSSWTRTIDLLGRIPRNLSWTSI
jgi:hypothetical protein